jgi:oxidase EvaA
MHLREWLGAARQSCDMRVEQIPRARSSKWMYDGKRVFRDDGAFFSIVGASVNVDGRRQLHMEQPLIDQPEIGILGFLIRRERGTTRVLVQAKPEPGNVGLLQVAPTVQATESNYLRRHRGKPTPLLERFVAAAASDIVADSRQSEQGTRFLGKYNRNMIVASAVPSNDVDLTGLAWCEIRALLSLLADDFQVNTDARSVLASAPWHELSDRRPFGRWENRGGFGEALLRSFEAREGLSSTAAIVDQLTGMRRAATFQPIVVGLSELHGWYVDADRIAPVNGGGFAIRQFAVTTTSREVHSWDQPLITASGEQQIVLACQEHDGVLHLLFDARSELGFRERLQFGPTLQEDIDSSTPPLIDLVRFQLRGALGRATLLMTCLQSDEGGRFFRCISRYSIRLLPAGQRLMVGDTFSWMTLGQVQQLIQSPGMFSNEARSAISMLLAYL